MRPIAAEFGRSAGTVGRELARNSEVSGAYQSHSAQQGKRSPFEGITITKRIAAGAPSSARSQAGSTWADGHARCLSPSGGTRVAVPGRACSLADRRLGHRAGRSVTDDGNRHVGLDTAAAYPTSWRRPAGAVEQTTGPGPSLGSGARRIRTEHP